MIRAYHGRLLGLMAAAAMTLTACSGADGPDFIGGGEGTDADGVTLRLTVDPGATAAGSRAIDAWEGPQGSFEQIRTLRVMILRGDPAHAYVEHNRVVNTHPNGVPTSSLEFKVRDNEVKRILLIANEASLPSPDPTKSVSAWLDSFERDATSETPVDINATLLSWTAELSGSNPVSSSSLFSGLGADARLPLTEWFDVPVMRTSLGRTDNRDSEATQSVHLFLTRAAVKATFTVEAEGYDGAGSRVTAISLHGINWQEFVFPQGRAADGSIAYAAYSPEKKAEVAADYNADGTIRSVERSITEFTTPGRTVVGGSRFDVPLAAPIAIENGMTPTSAGTIYFPETLFGIDGNVGVSVQLDGKWLTRQGDPEPGNPDNRLIVALPNLMTVGGHQAVARNTHLRIQIKFSPAGVTLEAEVLPYIGVYLDPEFGFDDLMPKAN